MQAESVGERGGQHRRALCVAACRVWFRWKLLGWGRRYVYVQDTQAQGKVILIGKVLI